MQPVAAIQILLMPDGRVVSNFQGAGRPQFNLMVETAKQDMLVKFREQEQGPKIELAPAGLAVH